MIASAFTRTKSGCLDIHDLRKASEKALCEISGNNGKLSTAYHPDKGCIITLGYNAACTGDSTIGRICDFGRQLW